VDALPPRNALEVLEFEGFQHVPPSLASSPLKARCTTDSNRESAIGRESSRRCRLEYARNEKSSNCFCRAMGGTGTLTAASFDALTPGCAAPWAIARIWDQYARD